MVPSTTKVPYSSLLGVIDPFPHARPNAPYSHNPSARATSSEKPLIGLKENIVLPKGWILPLVNELKGSKPLCYDTTKNEDKILQSLRKTRQTPLFPLLAPLVWFTGTIGFNTWVLTPPFPRIHLHKLLVFTPSSSIHAHFLLAIFQKKTMGTTHIWSLGTSCERLLQYSHLAWHNNTLEFGQTGLKRKENDSWPTLPIHIWCSTNSWLLFPMRQVY